MTTFFIGKILEVEYVERINKETKAKHHFTEISVMNEAYTEEGYYKPSIENIQIGEHHYDSLRDKIGQFVAIPFLRLQTKNGMLMFPHDSMSPVVMDKNPVDYSSFKRELPTKTK